MVARLAKEHGAHAMLVRDDPDEEEDYRRSRTDWVLVSRDPAALKRPAIGERGAVEPEDRPSGAPGPTTTPNLIQILK